MMEQQKTKKLRTTFTRHVGLPGLIILIVLSIYSGIFPTQAESILNVVQNYMYQNLSWVYVLLITSFMVFLLSMLLSSCFFDFNYLFNISLRAFIEMYSG